MARVSSGNGLAVLVLLPALLAWCPADSTAHRDIRYAQQKMRQRQSGIASIFGLAERIPFNQLRTFKYGRGVFEVGQLIIRVNAKEIVI